MATAQFKQVAYGLTQALIPEMQLPIISNRNPTTSDKAQFGSVWINQTTNGFFVLTSIVSNSATWATGSGGTGISTLTGDAGGAISPLAGNIDILGTAGQITVTGTANTLTISANGGMASDFDTDNGTATPVANILEILGGASTAGININTAGSGNTVEIILNDSLYFPNSIADGTGGVLYFGGTTFIHNFGTQNTFVGQSAGNLTLTATNSVAVGFNALTGLTSGEGNVAVGNASLSSLTSGGDNVAVGSALANIETGSFNTAVGVGAIFALDADGSRNTAVGYNTGIDLDTGNDNIFIGYEAGSVLETNESSNIIIGSVGTIGDNNLIRIGTQGAGAGQQNTCFIAGITGVSVANSATVLLNTSTGQLGTVVSSRRFKEDIRNIENENEELLKSTPVKFSYKNDTKKETAYGIIAEELHELVPTLVTYDDTGMPFTIKYHELPVLLLHEMKKMLIRIEELEKKIN